ncbi:TetR/AcrR family transcriptional regulator [Schaalia hyovaginalis]|uniref:AcrR family transcriptional regulator n=1 Tax=Schaalia hyovaginalis TaxID=29316 RepID=A0A923IYK6_9ACTO|nr:helix-turn-helix domain-containing protein [Schaalia hyovaginalis]MBB6335285.1 AcrR family transcriptional regulator [Schaalia hyovaginalis]MDY2669875.1 helix-turn-helix domain-containing protein [Schaalia hyovaginalis]
MPRQPRMNPDERLTQIVDTASELLSLKGYFGFSVGELAQRCGLSNAGLIHHIGTKQRVLHMVLDARDARDLAVMAEAAGGVDWEAVEAGRAALDTRTAVAMLHALVEHNETQPMIVRLYAILRNESLGDEHPSHDYFVARDAWSLRLLSGLFADATPQAPALGRQLLALMGGLEEQWLRDRSLSLVELWDEAVDILLAGHGIDAGA